MANAPAFVEGVVNLRGVIVPIVDLRLKMGSASRSHDASTVVIVLSVKGHVVGAVVDSVSDVLQLGSEQVKPAPDLGEGIDSRFIAGIGTYRHGEDQRMLILLDIEALMVGTELPPAQA